MEKEAKKLFISFLVISIIISSVFGGIVGFWAGWIAGNDFSFKDLLSGRFMQNQDSLKPEIGKDGKTVITLEQESATIAAVEKVTPAVVSIIVTKDLPIYERYYRNPSGPDFFREFFGDDFGDFFGLGIPEYRQKGTQEREIGGGSGFLVSADGYIITNRHVVLDEEASYTVIMNDETKHEATILARDQINDIAILKIEGKNLPYAELGDSTNLKVGQTAIAIGNSLGEFSNTVSIGVISGLSRSVTAGGYGVNAEQLSGVIQTDASINPGNSGGPLLDITGKVIGMNTAMAAGAENIGFAIPVNEVKRIYENVKKHGRIVRPWLGVRYVMINETIAEENKLDVDYGALVVRGEERTDLAVVPGSPADKAGLVENDIILELNGEKLDNVNNLAKQISKYNPGDEVKLKVLHRGEEKEVKVVLEEME